MADKNEKKIATKFRKWKKKERVDNSCLKGGDISRMRFIEGVTTYKSDASLKDNAEIEKRHFNVSEKDNAEIDILNDPLLIAAAEKYFLKDRYRDKRKSVFTNVWKDCNIVIKTIFRKSTKEELRQSR